MYYVFSYSCKSSEYSPYEPVYDVNHQQYLYVFDHLGVVSGGDVCVPKRFSRTFRDVIWLISSRWGRFPAKLHLVVLEPTVVVNASGGSCRTHEDPGSLKVHQSNIYSMYRICLYFYIHIHIHIFLTLHVMIWWTLRLMIHTPYTVCVQQPTTFRIIPQQVQHCSSRLRHLINAQTSRYWLEVHNPGGFIFFMLCSLVDWLIHFSAPIVSLFSDRSCTIYFSDPVHFNIKPLKPSTLRLSKTCGFETTKINGEWQLIDKH